MIYGARSTFMPRHFLVLWIDWMCKNKLPMCNTIMWYNSMITLEKCKEILNKGKRKYDNEEIKLLRKYLCLMAELQIENEKNVELINW